MSYLKVPQPRCGTGRYSKYVLYRTVLWSVFPFELAESGAELTSDRRSVAEE